MLKEDALDVEVCGDFNGTLREFFKELALTVWCEKEGFSGKRPFGNSGWENDVYVALIKAGKIPGKLDEDGWLVECDYRKADSLVADLIVEHL